MLSKQAKKYNGHMKKELTAQDIDRIVEMGWEDRTPFDAIKLQFGLKEQEVISIMRRNMKPSSFKLWRKRVQGRKTKHLKKRSEEVDRFKCSRQRGISNNKVSKR
jgi:uncharacterized protein (TIGR03643 family)